MIECFRIPIPKLTRPYDPDPTVPQWPHLRWRDMLATGCSAPTPYSVSGAFLLSLAGSFGAPFGHAPNG